MKGQEDLLENPQVVGWILIDDRRPQVNTLELLYVYYRFHLCTKFEFSANPVHRDASQNA